MRLMIVSVFPGELRDYAVHGTMGWAVSCVSSVNVCLSEGVLVGFVLHSSQSWSVRQQQRLASNGRSVGVHSSLFVHQSQG